MLGRIRRQRETAKESAQAQRNHAEAERHTQPLQDVCHRDLGLSLGGKSRREADRFNAFAHGTPDFGPGWMPVGVKKTRQKITPPDHIRRGKAPEKGKLLLQGSINGIELTAEVGAETVHHRDDCQRDARCDQTVFNRGRPRLI
jgi:hypothetical protein